MTEHLHHSEPALEVPDRITEWPEDDTALRAYPWRDALGIVWRYGVPGREHGWSTGSSRAWKGLVYGPWHREKGAEVERLRALTTVDDDMVERAVEAHRETFNAWHVKRNLEDAENRRVAAMRAALDAALGTGEA